MCVAALWKEDRHTCRSATCTLVRRQGLEPPTRRFGLLSCRQLSIVVETIALQRDLRFLSIGNLFQVVASCDQKMWRKVCVTATRNLTATGYLGAAGLGVAHRHG